MFFKIGDQTFLCSIGRNGVSSDKKEGDGTTPIGEFPIRKIFYRADHIDLQQLRPNLPCIALQENDGWCDKEDLLKIVSQLTVESKVTIDFSGMIQVIQK